MLLRECREPESGEIVSPRKGHTNWLSDAKWSALKTYTHNIIQTEQVVFVCSVICVCNIMCVLCNMFYIFIYYVSIYYIKQYVEKKCGQNYLPFFMAVPL